MLLYFRSSSGLLASALRRLPSTPPQSYNGFRLENHMGLSDQPIEISCPDCGAMIKVDPVTRAVISHSSAPRKRTFEDFSAAAQAARDADARRDSIFAQSVDAQKNRDDILSKKFAEAVKKAKETPDTGKPLRDFDLD